MTLHRLSLNEQQQKLDVIIDLVKSLNGGEESSDNVQRNMKKINQAMTEILEERNKLKNMETNKDHSVECSGLKRMFPLLMMGVVCISGYTTYKYTQKRK